jgi:hypothetical protein
MPAIRRCFYFVVMSLGFLGVVVCVAGVAGVWVIRSRLNQVVETTFVAIDHSLLRVDQRMAETQEGVEAARVTSQDMQQRLRDWAKNEAAERVSSRLEWDDKAEQLTAGLRQADDWLAFSESSIRLAQQAMELAEATGAPVESQAADRLMGELASLRTQLTQTIDTVGGIAERIGPANDEKLAGERWERAVQLAVKAIATLGSIESRLAGVRDRLSELQTGFQDLEARMRQWILITAIAISLLMAWMAAGQYLLCRHGWRRLGSVEK